MYGCPLQIQTFADATCLAETRVITTARTVRKPIMRKEDMTLHATGCRNTCDTVPPSAEIRAPASSSSSFFTPCAPQQRSAQPPLERNLPTSAGEDSVMSDHCCTLVSPVDTPPSCQPNSAPPPDTCKPPAEAAQSEATELLSSRVMYLKSVKCPHCAVVLYKKNLLVHIQRKH